MQNRSNPPHVLLVPRILWAALLGSTFVYYLILSTQPSAETGENPLLFPLSLVAGVVWVSAWLIPEFLLKSAVKNLPRPLDTRTAMSSVYPTFLILRLALAEAVCLLGFVLAQTSGVESYYPFWIAGLVIMVASFPRELAIAEKLKKYAGTNG